MRAKGKLIKWDNSKAFGFIAPNGDSRHIFIHKSAFSNRNRIPQINDIITFSKVKDKQGRNCAIGATFSGENLQKKAGRNKSELSIYLAMTFLGLMLAAELMGHIPRNLAIAYFSLSLLTFLVYWIDKIKAKRNAWRTTESTLHMLALFGGWPGAAIAQQTLRHKSKKKEFRIVFWLTVVVNVAALVWLKSSYGSTIMNLFS